MYTGRHMLGVAANPLAIIFGAFLGLVLKGFVSDATARRIEQALGFCTIVVAVKMALKFENVLVLIFCVGIGGVMGSLMRIEERTARFAVWVQARLVQRGDGKFAL